MNTQAVEAFASFTAQFSAIVATLDTKLQETFAPDLCKEEFDRICKFEQDVKAFTDLLQESDAELRRRNKMLRRRQSQRLRSLSPSSDTSSNTDTSTNPGLMLHLSVPGGRERAISNETSISSMLSPRAASWRGATSPSVVVHAPNSLYLSDSTHPFNVEGESVFTFNNIKNTYSDGYMSEYTDQLCMVPSLPPSVPNGPPMPECKSTQLRRELSFVVDDEDEDDNISLPMVPTRPAFEDITVDDDDVSESIQKEQMKEMDDEKDLEIPIKETTKNDDGKADGKLYSHFDAAAPNDDTKCDDNDIADEEEGDHDVEEKYITPGGVASTEEVDDEKCDSDELIQLPCFTGTWSAEQTVNVEFKKDDIAEFEYYSKSLPEQLFSQNGANGISSIIAKYADYPDPNPPPSSTLPTAVPKLSMLASSLDRSPSPFAAQSSSLSAMYPGSIPYAQAVSDSAVDLDSGSADDDSVYSQDIDYNESIGNESKIEVQIDDMICHYVDDIDDDDDDENINDNDYDGNDDVETTDTEEDETSSLLITTLDLKNDSEIVFIQYPPEPSPPHSNLTEFKSSEEEMETITAVEGENDVEGSNEPIISSDGFVSPNDDNKQCDIAESHRVPAGTPYPVADWGKDINSLKETLHLHIQQSQKSMSAMSEKLESIKKELSQQSQNGRQESSANESGSIACGVRRYC